MKRTILVISAALLVLTGTAAAVTIHDQPPASVVGVHQVQEQTFDDGHSAVFNIQPAAGPSLFQNADFQVQAQ